MPSARTIWNSVFTRGLRSARWAGTLPGTGLNTVRVTYYQWVFGEIPQCRATMGTKKQQYSEIDRHIGRQLRARRRELGLSLRELAKSLGISGQQVQKYEEGFNRVSASTLYVLAALLGVPLTFFFAGLRPPSRLRRNKIEQ